MLLPKNLAGTIVDIAPRANRFSEFRVSACSAVRRDGSNGAARLSPRGSRPDGSRMGLELPGGGPAQ